MTTTKISAQFYFEEEFLRANEPIGLQPPATSFSLKTGVLLDVNYQAKTFSISPQNPTDNFEFLGNRSGDYKKWKAVVKAIDAAIDFGVKEVEPKSYPLPEVSEDKQLGEVVSVEVKNKK